MCGICGLLGGPGSVPAVEGMAAALVHRGPDQGSVDAFGRCVLGHRRLCVLDLETGHQPVASEDGAVVAVFNGELYNYRELRAGLEERGHHVRGTGDTPVLPHLYEEFGLGFLERLEGMFALALWDARHERLVLARDRVGKKPLLYAHTRDGFVFASELKALRTLPGLDRELDLDALASYLALGYVEPPRTPFASVRKVPPGCMLVRERDEPERIEPYWTLEPAELRDGPDELWLDRVREAVGGAVRRRLAADVPLGALLSGGIDSTIVVALAAEASAEPLRTFSVGFPDARYDERAFARAVASRYGTVHEELELSLDAAALLPRLAETLDEPLADEAALPHFVLCEHARRSVTVALAGDGGDEAFAGYERYLADGLAAKIGRVPALPGLGARALRLLPAARGERRAPLHRAARLLDAAATPAYGRYGRLMEVFSPELAARVAPAWAGRFGAAELLPVPPSHGIADLQRLDATTYLPGDLLVKADLTSMAHSLELRSPFLDREVLELGLALPDRLRVSGRTLKLALRHAFAPELPPEVAARGKSGFGLPLARWFRSDLRELAGDVLLGAAARDRGLLDPRGVERLLAEHRRGRADHGARLWSLLMLELWLATYA